MSLGEINETVREGLRDSAKTTEKITTNPDGPLWYRGLALKDEEELDEELKNVFKAHGVERIVVGHTVSKGRIRLRAEERIVMIDVGMSKCYGGPACCLVIEKGKYYSVSPESREILIDSTSKTPTPHEKDLDQR